MAFKVPKSKASNKVNQFEFDIDGTPYRVPFLRYITGETVERIAELEAGGGMQSAAAAYAIFGPAGTPVGDAVRTLDREQLDALMDAFVEESKISPGESEAS